MMKLVKETEQDVRNFMLGIEKLKLELYNVIRDNENNHKKILLNILEIVDSMEERLLSAGVEEENFSDETKNWIAKFRMPYKRLLRLLSEENVVPMEVTVGEAVNPVWHQAIDTVKKEGAAEDTICEVHKKGYLLKGKLLRNSEVTIVKNKN